MIKEILTWLGRCPHKWGSWEQYEESVNLHFKDGRVANDLERRQRRHCTLCKKEQDQIIKGMGK